MEQEGKEAVEAAGETDFPWDTGVKRNHTSRAAAGWGEPGA